uniref:Putative secreted protein n=1 Tax=Panstrongylus lignarius TaxID=156445 RepID=A0A224XWD8_9HEMI
MVYFLVFLTSIITPPLDGEYLLVLSKCKSGVPERNLLFVTVFVSVDSILSCRPPGIGTVFLAKLCTVFVTDGLTESSDFIV